jgi:hypothetical protein
MDDDGTVRLRRRQRHRPRRRVAGRAWRLPVFFLPVDSRVAHVMVCDEVCLDAVRDRLPMEGTLPLSTSVVCATFMRAG